MSKKNITIWITLCIGYLVYANIKMEHLTDNSGTLFFTFYVASLLCISVIFGKYLAEKIEFFMLKSRYKDLSKQMEDFTKNRTYELKFSSDAVLLQKELDLINKKINAIKERL